MIDQLTNKEFQYRSKEHEIGRINDMETVRCVCNCCLVVYVESISMFWQKRFFSAHCNFFLNEGWGSQKCWYSFSCVANVTGFRRSCSVALVGLLQYGKNSLAAVPGVSWYPHVSTVPSSLVVTFEVSHLVRCLICKWTLSISLHGFLQFSSKFAAYFTDAGVSSPGPGFPCWSTEFPQTKLVHLNHWRSWSWKLINETKNWTSSKNQCAG